MKMTILDQWVNNRFAFIEAFDNETGIIYTMSGYLTIHGDVVKPPKIPSLEEVEIIRKSIKVPESDQVMPRIVDEYTPPKESLFKRMHLNMWEGWVVLLIKILAYGSMLYVPVAATVKWLSK